MHKAIALSMAILVSGCSSATYKQDQLDSLGLSLDPNDKIYVLTPENGSYGNKEYKESGRATAEAVRSAFSKYAKSVSVIKKCDSMTCIETEKYIANAYYVVPEIIHWEDRATEWSGISDKIKIRVVVYNDKKQEISANSFFGKSKFWTFGGDHPEELLARPLNIYAKSLY